MKINKVSDKDYYINQASDQILYLQQKGELNTLTFDNITDLYIRRHSSLDISRSDIIKQCEERCIIPRTDYKL